MALQDVEKLAERLLSFADTELRDYSPTYEQIVRGLAGDQALLGRLAPLGEANRVPGLVLAAVHDIVLAEPDLALAAIYAGDPGDPWPPFAALLDERFDEVAAAITTRALQTNEVGRTTALVPALGIVCDRLDADSQRPIALVDIGSSAGLNLLLDRYSYEYLSPAGDVVAAWGESQSPVHLSCTVIGGNVPALPVEPLPLASRLGIDLAPIDVRDDAAGRWLQACLWPDVPNRAGRLRGAVEVARSFPPTLLQGDVLEQLVPLLCELPSDVVPCIVSTWALAYLESNGRQQLYEQLSSLGEDRDLALVTAEYPHVTPWLPRPDRQAAVEEGKGATLLGLTTWSGGEPGREVLAWMQAHGQWIDWLA